MELFRARLREAWYRQTEIILNGPPKALRYLMEGKPVKRWRCEFVVETDDETDEDQVMNELDSQLDLWVDSDEGSILRAVMREVEEVD